MRFVDSPTLMDNQPEGHWSSARQIGPLPAVNGALLVDGRARAGWWCGHGDGENDLRAVLSWGGRPVPELPIPPGAALRAVFGGGDESLFAVCSWQLTGRPHLSPLRPGRRFGRSLGGSSYCWQPRAGPEAGDRAWLMAPTACPQAGSRLCLAAGSPRVQNLGNPGELRLHRGGSRRAECSTR